MVFYNHAEDELSDFYAGLFLDWDVDGATYTSNNGGYSFPEHLVYQYDPVTPYYYGGVALNGMDGNKVSKENTADLDEFRQQCFEYISTNDTEDPPENGDQRSWIGTKVPTMALGDTGWVTFALVAGDDLQGLRDNAKSAFEVAFEAGFTDIGVGVESFENSIPKDYFISQNYPNPFNPGTTIRFGLPFASKVKIKIYNLIGEVIDIPVNREIQAGY
ncbi:hypothetical protein ACFLS9_10285, partial [Bacteroidota bacterium]